VRYAAGDDAKAATVLRRIRRQWGNGQAAALAAGYSPGNPNSAKVIASNLLTRPNVKAAIDAEQAARFRARDAEITPQKLLNDLEDYKCHALRLDQVGVAVRATELQGKQIGMFVERSVNINVDLNGSHIEALAALIEARTTTQPGDDDED
jgi:phage terminase small subunit